LSINYIKLRKCINYNIPRRCKTNGKGCIIWNNTVYVRYSTLKTKVNRTGVRIYKKEKVYPVCDITVRRYRKPVTQYIIEKKHKQVSVGTDGGSTVVRTEGRICVKGKRLCDWNMKVEKSESNISKDVCYAIVEKRCKSDRYKSAVMCGSNVPKNTCYVIVDKWWKRKVTYIVITWKCGVRKTECKAEKRTNSTVMVRCKSKRRNTYNTRSGVCNNSGKKNKGGNGIYRVKNVPVRSVKIVKISSVHNGRVCNIYQTVMNITACLKMSAGSNDVEMADPLTSGQKGAYIIVAYKLQSPIKISYCRICDKVINLVSSPFTMYTLTPKNHIVKIISCRAVISLDCIYMFSYYLSKYQYVMEYHNSIRDPVGFINLGDRVSRVNKFIIWCKRYGE